MKISQRTGNFLEADEFLAVIEAARIDDRTCAEAIGRGGRARQIASREWAIQDSNLGPLPYQRSALTD
jgi:hypothetical protein